MNVAAVIKLMRDKGMSDTDILDVVQAGLDGERARSAAAERQARYRERKACDVTSDVTRDVTTPSPLVPPSLSPEPLNPPPYNPPNPTISVHRKRSTPSEFFDRFWAAYPRRDGANPKQPALKAFSRAVSSGADPEAIILGAQHYRSEQLGKDARFLAQAVTWLNQERWGDHCQPRLAVVQNATPPPRQQLTNEEVEAQVRAFGIIK